MPASPFWLSLLAQAAAPLAAGNTECDGPSQATVPGLERTLVVKGHGEQRVELPEMAVPVLVRVIERGIDVDIAVMDIRQTTLARAASPVIRNGTALAYVASESPRVIVIRSREHVGHEGSVEISVRPAVRAACMEARRLVADADMGYAAARAAAFGDIKIEAAPSEMFLDAARKYQAALAVSKPSSAERGALELALASLYYERSDWEKSAEFAERATATLNAAAEPYFSARARAILAAAWMEMATTSASGGSGTAVPLDAATRLEKARKVLRELEAFHRQRGEAYEAALQTNNIGLSYYYEARFGDAIPLYNAALRQFEQLGETPRMALALQNIALCEWGQGRLTAALPRFERAVELMDPAARPNLYLLTLNSSALAHYAAGQLDEALRLHSSALSYATAMHDDYYRGRSYMGLGITYYAIGDRRLAAQFLRAALPILTPAIDGRGRTTTLRSLAVIAHDEKRFAESASYNQAALESGVAASARARIKVRLAADYAALGDLNRARLELQPVISAPPGGDVLVRAEARLELGRISLTSRESQAARDQLNAALADFEATQSVAGEFETRVEIARLEAAQDRDEAAIAALTKALALADEIATQTGNPEYRASVVQSLRPAQDLMVDLQYARHVRAASAGQTAEADKIARRALEFADGTRAQSFGQILAQRHAGDDPALAQLLGEREKLLRDLSDRRYYLSTREDRNAPDDKLAGSLRAEIATLRAQLGVTNTAIAGRVRGRQTGSGPAAPELDFLRTPGNRRYVEYWLGANSYAWVAGSSGVRWIRLGDAATIRSAARALHESMRNFAVTHTDSAALRAARRQSLANLHALVIAPLGSLDGVDELILAADGPLHVVPFAALRGGGPSDQYLVAKHSIALVPALRFAGLGNAPRPTSLSSGRILLVDDPIYQAHDERLAPGTPGTDPPPGTAAELLMRAASDPARLERLPSTAREAAAIRARFDAALVELLEGLDATRHTFLAKDLAAYRFIHIASHGEMDTEIPQLSALILGRYGRQGREAEQKVWVDDFLGRTFNADVVVLSACDTSLGPEFAGEGPLGLRYAVLARGAHSVVSSLWPVADEITADLMTEMYGELTNKASRPDMALALAMRRLLQKRPNLDPAMWAPYTVHLAYQEQR